MNLKKRKGLFWLTVSEAQFTVSWPIAFGPVARKYIMEAAHGGRIC
jgi:hypothetical protein